MTPPLRAALGVLALAAALAVGASACWVNARAGDYACDDDRDCAGLPEPRRCDTSIGYCLPVQCPASCDRCDLEAGTCTIACGQGGDGCATVTCPAGWACDVTCTGTNACGTITCGEATACTVTCAGGNMNNAACDSVQCGAGPCEVTCGDDACGTVACNGSCACDVACANANACDMVTCPSACSQGTSCSARLPGCSTCP